MKTLAILLSVIACSVVGCEQGTSGLSGGGSSTPEAVLKKAEAARQAGDWKTYVNCHTSETIAAMVEQNLEVTLTLEEGKKLAALGGASAVAQVEKDLKPLHDLFAKHGITVAELEQLAALPAGDARQKAVKAAAGKVKDPRGFASEIMARQWKEMTKGAKVGEAQSTIKSVTINGDRATAMISSSIEGSPPFEIPMELKRTSAGWKIDNTKFYQP